MTTGTAGRRSCSEGDIYIPRLSFAGLYRHLERNQAHLLRPKLSGGKSLARQGESCWRWEAGDTPDRACAVDDGRQERVLQTGRVLLRNSWHRVPWQRESPLSLLPSLIESPTEKIYTGKNFRFWDFPPKIHFKTFWIDSDQNNFFEQIFWLRHFFTIFWPKTVILA